ncbi:MAG: DUF1638 domain-containing protein [Methanomethylovorans sp.]|jgi:hypothetical protein|nr:DUF1638 domain-containing protein [Methanomethylovorans sp.]
MPVMSIIACKILEEELFHVMSLKGAFDYLFIVDTKEAHGLIRRLKMNNMSHTVIPFNKISDMLQQTIACYKYNIFKYNIIRRICKKCTIKEDFIIVVHLLELGLHRDLLLLRRAVYSTVEDMSAFSDGIILFYGLCGNSLKDIETDLLHIRCPIYLIKDYEQNRVDDCISIALGGNRNYEKAFENCIGKGTLFFTPMWAANWKNVDAPVKNVADMIKMHDFFKKHYIRCIAKIERSKIYDPNFHDNVNKFAKKFGLEIISIPGNFEIVEKCYYDAKTDIMNKCK